MLRGRPLARGTRARQLCGRIERYERRWKIEGLAANGAKRACQRICREERRKQALGDYRQTQILGLQSLRHGGPAHRDVEAAIARKSLLEGGAEIHRRRRRARA